ncbi:MAG: DegT/DnrJ/EryC1/StrS aminotransferase family protein [Deltaproteobacteria bacterium]|nr:DegT/DnrJ/EryC1/StrS aminotransferase family protein [Deltaproteobacteria bacterium]
MDFIDLKYQQQRIKEKIDSKIQKVLAHGQYIMGPEVKELENQLAEYVGVRNAIGCASGTDALLLALMGYGVGPGDAIFTTPFTFIATAEAVSLLGATPIFVDIDPKTFNLDPAKLELAIQALKSNDPSIYPLPRPLSPNAERRTPNDSSLNSPNSERRTPNFIDPSRATRHSSLSPRGIIAVDLFGLPADYNSINSISQKFNLFVVEDGAQSFGAEYFGRRACSLSDLACTSFFPAKPLGGYGDGGMCFTNDDPLAEVMRSLRIHGQGNDKYENIRIGINGRLDTLQAAILLAKLEIFPEEIELRQEVAQNYTTLMSPNSELHTPNSPPGYQSAWAQYSILSKSEEHRSIIMENLKRGGVPMAIYYPKPLHLQKAFAFLNYSEGDFPISEDCAKRIFSLPMHPYLKPEDQERIINILRAAQ